MIILPKEYSKEYYKLQRRYLKFIKDKINPVKTYSWDKPIDEAQAWECFTAIYHFDDPMFKSTNDL